MSASHDRERELERLRDELASRRAEWVPRIAPNAQQSKSPKGWRLGDITGVAGNSLFIYADREHQRHIDFNGEQWKGDDLDLIRALCRKPDFPSTVEHAAGLIGFRLDAWGKKGKGKKAAVLRTRVFEYRDATGAVLFEAVRQELADGSKCIFQRRTDASGRIVPNLKGVPLVPYRLPELIAAIDSGQIVYIVEGEAKVSLLTAWGLAATCNSGGAGKWRLEHAEPFRRRKVPVVILPDNDDAGRTHAQMLAECLHPLAETVKIIELPDLGPKEDIVDWAKRGGTREMLVAIVSAAPQWNPNAVKAPERAAATQDTPIELKEAKLSQRDALLDVVDAATVWRTPEGETYATIRASGHIEHHSLASRAFRDWALSELARRYTHNSRPAAVNANTIRDAMLSIEARAHSTGLRHRASLRVAERDGTVFLDLGTEDWSAVEVTRDGWRIVPSAPVPLVRTRKTAPFPKPKKPGDLTPLRCMLGRLGEDDFVLFVAWCLGALYPSGPYPILMLSGEAGSGKTTLTRLARRLTDPTQGDLLQPPGDDRDLIAAARNNRVLAFDNISSLKPDLADGLCRVATGGELGGRALFSDHDQATFAASRPVVLNGIPDLASRGDLASRAIVLRLGPLEEWATERNLSRQADAALAPALGALLDALKVALTRLDSVPTPHTRMADFARLVLAAEPALPWKPGAFLPALARNSGHVAAGLIEGDSIAAAVRAFAADHPEGWQGGMSELFKTLSAAVPHEVQRGGDWPGNARWFADKLRRAAPALRVAGVDVRDWRTSKGATVWIGKIASLATPKAPRDDANDAISQVCEVRL